MSALQNVKLKPTGLSQTLISPENTDEQPSHASNLSLATSSPGIYIHTHTICRKITFGRLNLLTIIFPYFVFIALICEEI